MFIININLCCRCVKVEVDLDAVGDAKIDIGGREFDLVTEAEGIDKEHGAITPVDVYQARNIFTSRRIISFPIPT